MRKNIVSVLFALGIACMATPAHAADWCALLYEYIFYGGAYKFVGDDEVINNLANVNMSDGNHANDRTSSIQLNGVIYLDTVVTCDLDAWVDAYQGGSHYLFTGSGGHPFLWLIGFDDNISSVECHCNDF